MTVGELASHGHLVRTWNVVSGTNSAPQLYKSGRWENYTGENYAGGAFRVSGTWDNNAVKAKNAPQGGYGDQAGTTDGTGGNAYHNNISPAIAAYVWQRTV